MTTTTSERTKVLDHGYVELVDVWGSEERIVEAARMSTGKGFLGWGELKCSCGATSTTAHVQSTDGDRRLFVDDAGTRCPTERGGAHIDPSGKLGDEKLLRFLWENRHQTPFEMAGLTIEVQAPIFVFREWHRHRVPFGYNEMSARYTPLPDFNYVPTLERLMVGGSSTNKQAGVAAGAAVLDEAKATHFRARLEEIYFLAEELYQEALASGVPKELARVHLPVGRYSRMRATANLRGWLGFLGLRMAPGAQWEIRQFANVVGKIVAEKFPRVALLSGVS